VFTASDHEAILLTSQPATRALGVQRRYLKLCDELENDPWGREYKAVVKRVSAGNRSPNDPVVLEGIVQVLFLQKVAPIHAGHYRQGLRKGHSNMA